MDKLNKRISIGILFIILLGLIWDWINRFLHSKDMYIILKGHEELYITVLGVGLLVILVFIFIIRYFKNLLVKVILCGSALILGFYLMFGAVFGIPDWKYKEFESLNKENKIVIRENVFLFGGDIQVLKMKNEFLGQLIVTERSDDDNRLDGNFSLKWENNNEAIFKYRYFGSSNITKIKF